MKASDFIVEYLLQKGVKHVFGYPGGMVTHLMDSFRKYEGKISAHLMYHEQGAALAACGYAQAKGKMGVAYATSGPGATNLITGICNAYFDSIPVLFLTGQVNSFELKGGMGVRQRGFQETDIVSMVKGVTKYAAQVKTVDNLKFQLDYAFWMANHGRKGPVLLDVSMDVFRAEIEPDELYGYSAEKGEYGSKCGVERIVDALKKSKRPVFLLGQGIWTAGVAKEIKEIVLRFGIPTVSTMLATDIVSEKINFGFIGAYGTRAANFIVADCDLLISLGARLDVRQVGSRRNNFAPNAKIIRVEVDAAELDYKVHEDEIGILGDLSEVVPELGKIMVETDFSEWFRVCDGIRNYLKGMDEMEPTRFLSKLGRFIPKTDIITADVGQNEVWVVQALGQSGHRILLSGGHGTMGYSLPAAVGSAFATGKAVYSFQGDGGLQMNLQELQTIVRENLPIKIILLNNESLGMIRHFQEMYFEKEYFQTKRTGGYSNPDFAKIANAYGIPYRKFSCEDELVENPFTQEGAQFIEVRFDFDTYVFPKLEFGKPNQDQEPLINRDLYNLLNNPEEVLRNLDNGK